MMSKEVPFEKAAENLFRILREKWEKAKDDKIDRAFFLINAVMLINELLDSYAKDEKERKTLIKRIDELWKESGFPERSEGS